MNIPNILTTIRLCLIPLFILVFFSNSPHSFVISMIIFITSGITDILDGYIARKYNKITKFGTVADPFADKLTLLAVLFALYIKGFIPTFILTIVILKEVTMILGGLFLYKRNIIVPSNIFGKSTTVLFFIGILSLLLSKQLSIIILYIAILSALISFCIYLKIIISKK
ncbi:Phosphatidylglycerophosphate synthase [Clostridium bornimense]|uniref:CDP-diacylglycerol--glycerol-3-phosphate 3-phosphatidyltransferase n=1 Tax=Clostridium bornimense TaxID=1216932 RepID=W6RYR2_9CLOT|nr:Phosphatidylglycerophosphate synthase [Clostridium bornimense]